MAYNLEWREYVAATVRLPSRPYMLLHVRMQARFCRCTFHFASVLCAHSRASFCVAPMDVHARGGRSTFATPDLLLQNPDETHATFR
jgi:hypothetical protein